MPFPKFADSEKVRDAYLTAISAEYRQRAQELQCQGQTDKTPVGNIS